MLQTVSSLAAAFGLSTASGLNAYLPLLVVALTARYTNLITLNKPWDILTNRWVIGVLGALLLIELTVDKIPAVDTLNDVIQTVGRPLAGAIVFAAGSGTFGELNPVLAFIAGLILAGSVHAAKSTARPLVTAATGGTGNWLVSIAEDAVSLAAAILSILMPLLVMVIIVGVMIIIAWRWSMRRQRAQLSR